VSVWKRLPSGLFKREKLARSSRRRKPRYEDQCSSAFILDADLSVSVKPRRRRRLTRRPRKRWAGTVIIHQL